MNHHASSAIRACAAKMKRKALTHFPLLLLQGDFIGWYYMRDVSNRKLRNVMPGRLEYATRSGVHNSAISLTEHVLFAVAHSISYIRRK